jgi:tetratricopeptide (TPR) repeat protein
LLRPSVLDAYRMRVHDFIDAYREKGWPADTPEYALTGYPQMLREHRDTAGLTRLATDPARHERLWLTTGSDTLALTEIADAFALHEAEPEADLVACVRLSSCRDELQRKALSFPSSAITVLGKLGHCHKAAALLSARVTFSSHETNLFTLLLEEALAIGEEDVVLNAAHGLVQPSVRDQALKYCTVALAGADQVDRGIELTRSISDAEQRCDAFVFMAWRLLDRGQRDAALRPVGEAAHAARAVEAPTRRAMALTLVARAMMDAERPRAAVDLAREAAIVVDELNVAEDREQSLGPVAVVLARAGHVGDAIRLVGTIVDAERRAWALADVAETLVKTEESETAVGLARQVAEEARKLRHELDRESLLERAAIVLTRAERTDDAVQLVCRVGDGERRAKALAWMAEILAEIGKSEAAAGLACDAAEVAGSIGPEDQRMDALKRAAQASVRAGQLDDAVGLASSIEASGQRAELLCEVALAMVDTGHLEQAVPQCLAAAVLSDDIADDTERIAVLLSVSQVFDKAGETETAIRYARRAADAALTADAAEQRASALVQTAEMLINSGQRDEAARCVDLAIDVARFAPDPRRTASRSLGVARALIGAGRMGEAEALVSSAVDLVSSPVRPATQAQMLCEAARLLTDLNRTDTALQLAAEAVRRGRGDIDPDDMARALADVAGALAEKGRTSEAVQLTRTAADFARATTITRWRAWALRDVAIALTKAARIEESIELAEAITESGDRAKALAALTEMLAKTGRVEEAARLAHHAVNVARSEPNASERCAALAAVAASMVARGRSDEAVFLADALVEEHSTLTSGDAAVGVACVAEALAQAGRTSEAVRLAERAAQLARATTEIFGQDEVLSIVVNALVKAGQLAQAVRAANGISDPARLAPALAKTAAAYGLTAEGRSLLRRALSLHSHGAFLQDLAAVAPEALDEAVHRIQAGQPGDA